MYTHIASNVYVNSVGAEEVGSWPHVSVTRGVDSARRHRCRHAAARIALLGSISLSLYIYIYMCSCVYVYIEIYIYVYI